MANAFKNASIEIGISDTLVYTCPAATSAVIFAGYISNKDGTESINITMKVWDASATTLRVISGKDTPINVGGALTIEKISLEEDDQIHIVSSKAAACDAFLSILEIT